MFALLDAHNFYASVEGDMRPALRSHPYVILSANDGAVVARSELARALGVKMGEPWFKLKDMRELNGLMEILFRYEAPALADAANGALRRDAEH